MRGRLGQLAEAFRHWLTTPVLDFSGQVYGRLWDAHWFVAGRKQDLHNLIVWVRSNFGWVPFVTEITGWIDDQIDGVASAVQSLPDRGIAWFNENVNPETNEWQWLTEVRAAAQKVKDLADAIGEWIDRIGTDPVGWVRATLDPLEEHIGATWGYGVQAAGELDANPWPDIRAAHANWWDRIAALARLSGDVLGGPFARLWDRVWDAIDGPLSAVGNALGALESIIREAPPNRWPEVRGTGSYVFATIETMGHLVAQALAQRFTNTLIFARDTADALVASGTHPIREWITGAQGSIDWVRANAGNVGLLMAHPQGFLWGLWWSTLWPTVERWLADVWDGNA